VARAFRATGVSALVLGMSHVFCATSPPPHAAASSPKAERDDASIVAPIVTILDEAGADPFGSPTPASDTRFAAVDDAVAGAIAEGRLPGCVVVIGRKNEILFRRAYGMRAIEPARAPMTLDTVFDLASLTKVVATAASVMVLVDRGLVGLDEPAARYVPDFGRANKGTITVRQLLLHVSGLPADNPMSDYARGPDEAWKRIADGPPRRPPGDKLVYSDVGFIVLGELVRRVSGKDLGAFAAENVFAPLGMRETTFNPKDALRARAATTELREGAWMVGEVHDPRAYALGGVAGHAGLFSTGRDMARFAQSWLSHGEGVVSAKTFDAFAAAHDVPGGIRALGWDVASAMSANRADGLSRRAIGHSGYTGTSLWLDPANDLFVLFLSNRVHPAPRGSILELAARIGSAAARLSGVAPPVTVPDAPCERPASDALAGIDVLKAENFARLRGRKIALLTNSAARAKDGTRTIDVLARANGVEVVRIFTPEHGLGADREGAIPDGRDAATGLPVVSLYGASLAPAQDALERIDTVVFDIQDVGTRFYTYASTMRRALRAAADARLRFVVLDRPNPIDGVDVCGPLVDTASRNFVHHAALPVRHGMTIGELALMFDAEEHLGADLEVVKVQGWRRSDYLDATGLAWTPPSPNLRSVTQALLYPAIGLLEGTNLSVGRGTDTPFEIVGAPFVDGQALATALAKRALPGVSFAPATFIPAASPYRGEKCAGVRVTVTDRARFEPVRTGIALAMDLRALHAKDWHFDDVNRLLANRTALDAIAQNKTISEIEATWERDLVAFRAKRDKYLLYPTCTRAP
jgi:uncharacterized protein YbbC (DUF1343 family)